MSERKGPTFLQKLARVFTLLRRGFKEDSEEERDTGRSRMIRVADPPGTARKRIRPRLQDKAWVEKTLEETACLGNDHTSPEKLAEMIGDRGKLPWKKP